MSKTRRNQHEEYYDDEEYGYDIDDYRQQKKMKRMDRALKTLDIDDLLDMEDEE